jgi:hypothetical protein
MRFASFVLTSLLVSACGSDDTVVTTADTPRSLAIAGDRVVVVASNDTIVARAQPTQSSDSEDDVDPDWSGCGAGEDGDDIIERTVGASIVFVSDDGGRTYDRVQPNDGRAMHHVVHHDGRFFGLVTSAGAYAVLASDDGRRWTQVTDGMGTSPHLSATAGGLLVVHETAAVRSTDGDAWIEHDVIDDGFYQPIGAIADGKSVAIVGGVLFVETAPSVWSQRSIDAPGDDEMIHAQIVPVDDDILVITSGAAARYDLDAGASSLALDGRDVELPSAITPMGFLDRMGQLHQVTSSGIADDATPHIAPFFDIAVSGDRVAVVADNSGGEWNGTGVAISRDGGRTFGTPVALPLSRD